MKYNPFIKGPLFTNPHFLRKYFVLNSMSSRLYNERFCDFSPLKNSDLFSDGQFCSCFYEKHNISDMKGI